MSPARGKKVEAVDSFSCTLPPKLKRAVDEAHRDWDNASKTSRLWEKDASLWTNTDESKWLGWLDIVDEQLNDVSKFKALSAEIQEDGFSDFLLLGMGGSSLAPEVFGTTFGKQIGSPELLVLDSTDPLQVRRVRSSIDPVRTLFCVSSKSGTTLEPNIFMEYFFEETRKSVGERAGHHFIAVTDPGSMLEGVAEKFGFRRLYHGNATIGGRYSALSDFGLVPHAAAGLDTEKLLKRAKLMVEACKNPDSFQNPGVSLGLILGTAAAQFARDKVTLITSRSVLHLGAWLEQLLAESTGKEGKGLIPVDREPEVEADRYGTDRIFAYLRFDDDADNETEKHVAQLERAGHPVIRIVIGDLYDIGQTMFLWEIATAVAGAVIGINPFNQPDVEASKIVTRELTSGFEQSGSLPEEGPILEHDGIELFTDDANAEVLTKGGRTLGAVIREHMDRISPGDYFALLAYIPMFPEYEEILQDMRRHVVDSKQVATVLGFGPRFLHSTGQAYKGGPNSGVFLQITCTDDEDLQVPQQGYTFGVVKAAQARGDFQVLAERHRRVLRAHIATDLEKGLTHLRDLLCAAIEH